MATTAHPSNASHHNVESEFAIWIFIVILVSLACYATYQLWDRVQAY